MSQAPKVDGYLLRELHEVALPEPVSYWPQTLGWQIVAVLLVVGLIYFGIKTLRHWWHNRYRREAIEAVESLAGADLAFQAVELNRVLRIVTDHVYARGQVPKGLGKPFLEFLDTVAPTTLNTEAGQAWQQALCLPPARWTLTQDDMAQIRNQAVRWLKTHGSEKA